MSGQGAEPVNDPELCTYESLDPVLQNEIRERFLYTFHQAIDRKFEGADEWPLGVESMSVEALVSRERNDDGDRWLKLLTTDGSTWYSGWEGHRAFAVDMAASFGESNARSFKSSERPRTMPGIAGFLRSWAPAARK